MAGGTSRNDKEKQHKDDELSSHDIAPFAICISLSRTRKKTIASRQRRAVVKTAVGKLLDFFYGYASRDQGWNVCSSLQIPHMSPMLYDNMARFFLGKWTSIHVRGLIQVLAVFLDI